MESTTWTLVMPRYSPYKMNNNLWAGYWRAADQADPRNLRSDPAKRSITMHSQDNGRWPMASMNSRTNVSVNRRQRHIPSIGRIVPVNISGF